MMRRRGFKTAAAAALVFLVIASAGPAQATTTIRVGESSSTPSPALWAGAGTASSFDGSKKCDYSSNASAVVRPEGDYTYVKDACADGKSAVAMVTGDGNKRICRNTAGSGTWVRCNWNWKEDSGLQFTAGVYEGSTGVYDWDGGGSAYFKG